MVKEKKQLNIWRLSGLFVFSFLALLLSMTPAKADNIVFHEITTSSNSFGAADNYQGQIFYSGTTTNLSKIAMGFGGSSDINITEIAICKGLLPDLSGVAEWDTNAITCNWSGHERIFYETNSTWTYSVNFYGLFDYYYELTTPIELETNTYYYFVFKNDANVTYYQQNSAIGGFVPHGSASGYWDYGTTAPGIQHVLYYDDEWTPPPTSCSVGYTLINNNCILTNNLNSLNLPFSILSPYNCYNESTCKVNYFYDENKITIYDTIDIYKYDSPTSTEKTLIHDDLSIIDYNAFGKRNGESYFTLTGTSTTTGFEYYEMIGNKAEYWDRETLETVPATTTTPYLIVINWINTEIPTIEEIIANINTSTTTASTIWDINSYELACTDEEWNSTSTYLGLNLTTTLCQIKKLGFDMMLTTGEFAKSQGEKLGKFIGNIFPFGFMKQINNSWKNSKNETINSDNFFFKNFEENGEISLTLPAEINGTASTTKLYIWGQTAWGEDVQEIINAIRWLSTYLLWLSFIYGIYETGKNIYEEIKE